MTAISTPRSTKTAPSLGYGDYVRFNQAVEEHFGLYFPEKRRIELEQGLRQAFAASTCTDLDEYFRLLQSSKDGALEMDRLVNALTVGETYFFRDEGQFDALYHHVLPQIIERRRPVRTLRIWSAGCASGEEAYSLAIMLRELLPDVDDWAITILGTDVNTEALDRARKAVYGNWAFREERAKRLQSRYFQPQGNRYELAPDIRRMVTFARLNLAANNYPSFETNTTLMDLIICRNVTIYFSEAATKQVVTRLYSALVDGGWLVVGHSEPSPITYRRFQVHSFPNAILYQRTGQPTPLPRDWDWLVGTTKEQPAIPEIAPSPIPSPPAPQIPPPTPEPLPREGDPLETAQELLEYGHSEEARDLLLDEVEQSPQQAPACALLGQAYANLGHWAEAEHWCREAIRIDKLQLDAYHTLALVLQHQGELDAAIDAMKKVVYIDRHSILGHFGLADLYRNKSQLPHAQKSLDNARRLLETKPLDEIIPDSGGITAGRLQQTIVRQQQQWSADVAQKLENQEK